MKRRRIKEKITAVFAAIFAVVLNTIIVLAEGEGETTSTAAPAAPDISVVTKPLDVIKTLSISVVGTIGAILIVWAVFEIAQAFMAHDTSQIGLALKRLVGGALCAAVAVILALMGF